MQAITTLHAQLCAATEKLDQAQKASNVQDNRIRQLRDESKMKWGEIEELTKMLSDVMDEERLEKEKLEELLVQIVPLELEYQRKSGHIEILPAAFKKLTDDFMDESRETMFKIEDLLSLARRENFWKSKIAMNMYHINADRIRLRQQKLTLNDAHLAEVNTLNKQLAHEEYLLAMVQARFDTAEKKKVQQMTKSGYQQTGRTPTSGRGGNSFQYPPFQEELVECLPPDNKIAMRPLISDGFQSNTRPAYGAGMESIYSPKNQAMQRSEPVVTNVDVRCHGCHKYGHFVLDCPNCYKCGLCNKHHLNGTPCSSKTTSSSSSSANYEERGLSSSALSRETNQSPSSLPTPGPIKKSYEAIQGSYGSSSYPPPASAVVTPRRPLMSQHHLQQQQYSIPGDGHVTHTVTRTITEEVMESVRDIEGDRENDDDSRMANAAEMDERPWFQMMKRKRSVTEVLNQNNFRGNENMFEYDYEHPSQPMQIQGRTYPSIEDQHNRGGVKGKGQSPSVPNQDTSMASKGHPAFRSGLQLLLDAEK